MLHIITPPHERILFDRSQMNGLPHQPKCRGSATHALVPGILGQRPAPHGGNFLATNDVRFCRPVQTIPEENKPGPDTWLNAGLDVWIRLCCNINQQSPGLTNSESFDQSSQAVSFFHLHSCLAVTRHRVRHLLTSNSGCIKKAHGARQRSLAIDQISVCRPNPIWACVPTTTPDRFAFFHFTPP